MRWSRRHWLLRFLVSIAVIANALFSARPVGSGRRELPITHCGLTFLMEEKAGSPATCSRAKSALRTSARVTNLRPAMKRTGKYESLGRDFYARHAATVARELLGYVLVRVLDDGTVLTGRIVETEAYLGESDPACHSARGATEVRRLLSGPAGFAYVYLCYGTSHCFNIVAEPEGRASAVLFRALEPIEGVEQMRRHRPHAKRDTDLCSGPGRLCQALDIDIRLNATDMTRGQLFVAKTPQAPSAVEVSPRVGIRKAADWPLRFYVADNPHVSRAKPGVPRQRKASKKARAGG